MNDLCPSPAAKENKLLLREFLYFLLLPFFYPAIFLFPQQQLLLLLLNFLHKFFFSLVCQRQARIMYQKCFLMDYFQIHEDENFTRRKKEFFVFSKNFLKAVFQIEYIFFCVQFKTFFFFALLLVYSLKICQS